MNSIPASGTSADVSSAAGGQTQARLNTVESPGLHPNHLQASLPSQPEVACLPETGQHYARATLQFWAARAGGCLPWRPAAWEGGEDVSLHFLTDCL